MIKGSIQEEDITVVNIYAPNIGAPQYIRQILTDKKGEIDSNTRTVGDFNIPLPSMERLNHEPRNAKASLKPLESRRGQEFFPRPSNSSTALMQT